MWSLIVLISYGMEWIYSNAHPGTQMADYKSPFSQIVCRWFCYSTQVSGEICCMPFLRRQGRLGHHLINLGQRPDETHVQLYRIASPSSEIKKLNLRSIMYVINRSIMRLKEDITVSLEMYLDVSLRDRAEKTKMLTALASRDEEAQITPLEGDVATHLIHLGREL